MKKIINYLIFLAPIVTLGCGSNKQIWSGKVSDVHDGDTITVANKRIRLFGVDTPELNDQNHDFIPTSDIDHIYAEQAKNFVAKHILNKSVTIINKSNDQYGRLVSKVNFGYDLGLSLVKNGWARVAYISLIPNNPFYTGDSGYYKLLLKAQHYAYEHNNGIWAHKELFKKIFPKA